MMHIPVMRKLISWIGNINIHYRAFIGSFIYLISTRVGLSFSVHKLANFSSNPGKLHFEGLVHLLRYIRDNDAQVYDLLRKSSIKTEKQLIAFSYSIWKYCPDTGRSTGSYIISYKGGPIEHITYVPGPVSRSSAES